MSLPSCNVCEKAPCVCGKRSYFDLLISTVIWVVLVAALGLIGRDIHRRSLPVKAPAPCAVFPAIEPDILMHNRRALEHWAYHYTRHSRSILVPVLDK